MVGIALIVVTDSRSISSSPFCASHLRIITTLPPVATADTMRAVGTRDVEQRHGQQGHRLRILQLRQRFEARAHAQQRPRAEKCDARDERADVAVCAERALRATRRPGRIQNGRIVVGLQRNGRQFARTVTTAFSRPVRLVNGADTCSSRAMIAPARSNFGKLSASRSALSLSRKTRRAPQSSSAYSSSPAVHHAFSGTAIAPTATVAQNAIDHSGKFLIAIATRSPLRMPNSRASSVRQRDDLCVVLGERELLRSRKRGRSGRNTCDCVEHVSQGGWRILPATQRHAADRAVLDLEGPPRRRQQCRDLFV